MTPSADERARRQAPDAAPDAREHATPDDPLPPALPPLHEHTPDEERRIREAALDETIADSFPASDPSSTDPNPDNHDAMRPDAPGSER